MSEHIFSMKSVISKSFEKVQLFYKNKLFQLYQIRINKILINKQDKTIIRWCIYIQLIITIINISEYYHRYRYNILHHQHQLHRDHLPHINHPRRRHHDYYYYHHHNYHYRHNNNHKSIIKIIVFTIITTLLSLLFITIHTIQFMIEYL